MPRGPRLDFPGALHHVIARGLERRRIFRDDWDRARCLERLDRVVSAGGAGLYAWCFMPNHAHALIRTGPVPLARLIQRWLGPYATGFNLRHRRAGHLFQNRFKSVLVEEEPYLLELVRYIHLNPVRARRQLVTLDGLDEHAWTGHAVLLGRRELGAQDTAFVLRHFGAAFEPARSAYRAFVRAGRGVGSAIDLDGGGLRRSAGGWVHVRTLARGRERWAHDERVLGTSAFVHRVVDESPRDAPAPPADPSTLIPILCADVAPRFAVAVSEVERPSLRRPVLDARAVVSDLAVRQHGLPLTVVGRHLGVSKQSVARSLVRALRLRQTLGRDVKPCGDE